MSDQRKTVIKNANTSISLRFGFIGLGMGGTSIAAACGDVQTNVQNNRQPYTSLLINTNQMDLNKIQSTNPTTKKLLIGSGKGAGRDIETGENIFLDNIEIVRSGIEKQFEKTDFIWIVAGLGGGSGTGAIIHTIGEAMRRFPNRFGIILTLPRLFEGSTVINNAIVRLEQIKGAMHGIGPIILVDNEKLYQGFSKDNPKSTVADYLTFSNNFVAETLHEINVITSSFTPFDDIHFDTSEFENLLQTSGVLHFARFASKTHEVDSAQSLSHIGKLKEQIENGVLSDGYDLRKTKRLAVSILANQSTANRLYNFDFRNAIEEEITRIAPSAEENPVAQYTYPNKEGLSDIHFFAVFAGLDMPAGKIKTLVAEQKRLVALRQEEEERISEDPFAGFSAVKKDKKDKAAISFDDLFGAKKEDNKDEDKSKDAPVSEDQSFINLFGTKIVK
jgi:cell division GTPase FtsZ